MAEMAFGLSGASWLGILFYSALKGHQKTFNAALSVCYLAVILWLAYAILIAGLAARGFADWSS